MIKRREKRFGAGLLAACTLSLVLPLGGAEVSTGNTKPDATKAAAPATSSDLEQLKAMLLEQQRQIDELRKELARQKKEENNGSPALADVKTTAPAAGETVSTRTNLGEVASTTPIIPLGTASSLPAATSSLLVPPPAPQAAGASQAQVDALQKAIDAINGNLRGFRLSGDLRFRNDLLVREANKNLPPGDNRATPAQRDRERYRFRLNIDKDLFYSDKSDRPLAHAHVQLATDPFNNPNTMDTDFTGIGTRAPISIAEAYVDVMPTKSLTLRIGRTPEVFADNRQFVYDDDIRLNGFHETYRFSGKKNGVFLQFAAAQYILTEPNVQVVPAGSPFIAAGYKQGQRIPSSNLFDMGVTFGSNIGKKWSHNETLNYFVIREPNQLALAATANGAALFATSSVVGATLTGNLPESGNGLTTAGGAIFTSGFKVVRFGTNLNYTGFKPVMGHNMPFTLFGQVTHNTDADFDNTGYMVGTAIGQAARKGDFQFQYQYFYKPGNAFISTLTDDDVGTGAGVNVKTHQIRLNFGLTRFLAWENRLYIQKGISTNNPALNYFLPLQAGYNTQFRLHSQFVFTF
jgi:Putative porin